MSTEPLRIRYGDVLEQAHSFLKSKSNPVKTSAAKERKKYAEKVGAQCPICGASITELGSNEEHILPKNLGGKHNSENRVLMCFSCNLFRDQLQRMMFGGQGADTARKIFKENPETVDSYILWLQITVDEGIVAGATYEEVREANEIFSQMGGRNQPNLSITNTLGRYSEWSTSTDPTSKSPSLPKKGLSDLVRRTETHARNTWIESTTDDSEFKHRIRSGIIEILLNARYSGKGISNSIQWFGGEFNRFIREEKLGSRKDVNESLGLIRSTKMIDLLKYLFTSDELIITPIDNAYTLHLTPKFKRRMKPLHQRITSIVKRVFSYILRPIITEKIIPIDDSIEIESTIEISEPSIEADESEVSDFVGSDHDPVSKILRGMAGQTIEIADLGDRIRKQFPLEHGTPRQWLLTQGHPLKKPFSQILAESYPHLIQDKILHTDTIVYVLAEAPTETSGGDDIIVIPYFSANSKGFQFPRAPQDVASILVAIESLRGKKILFGDVLDSIRARLNPPMRTHKILHVIVRLRDYLEIHADEYLPWDKLESPLEVTRIFERLFIEQWIPSGSFAGKIPHSEIKQYFDAVRKLLDASKSTPSLDPKDWLYNSILDVIAESNSEWAREGWFFIRLIDRIKNSEYESRENLVEAIGFERKKSMREVVEAIMGPAVEIQDNDNVWRIRIR